ncbi:MAG: aminotransferase class I/II-fold pyridoxal phosphate-dependent enzyme, partial [Pseudomonadota bacterium]
GTPLIHETKPGNGFKAAGRELADLIAEKKPRAVIMNSPSNPTGGVYSEAELRDVHEACKKENVFIISDEIYSTLVYDGKKHFSALHLTGRVEDDICVINGMSKSFAMTGWRIGWAVAAPGIIKAIAKVSAQTTSCAPSFIQKGCAEVLKDHPGEINKEWKEKLRRRRDRLVDLVSRIDGVRCDKPEGAFYVWVDVRGLMKRSLPDGTELGSSGRLSAWLIDDCALVSVPGSAFGCEGFLRFSFAISTKDIEEGVERFAGSVKKLTR